MSHNHHPFFPEPDIGQHAALWHCVALNWHLGIFKLYFPALGLN
jgi:hypothetical protein